MSSQQKFTQFYIYSVLFLKIQRGMGALSLMFKICPSKIGISLHMKMCRPHMNDINRFPAKRYFHVCCYTWVTAAICFTVKLTVDGVYSTLGIVYKHDNPFIHYFFFWYKIWIIMMCILEHVYIKGRLLYFYLQCCCVQMCMFAIASYGYFSWPLQKCKVMRLHCECNAREL
jgi:hypothetical protein